MSACAGERVLSHGGSTGDATTRWGHPGPSGTMTDVDHVEVVVAHQDCATLHVGDVFLKIDGDQKRTSVEVEAMRLAPIPTPKVLWRKPPVLALAALGGTALGHLGQPSTASPTTWAAVGAAVRRLHDAPLPPWPGRSLDETASRLDQECTWLLANDVLPADLVTRNRRLAETALRPWTPMFTHGDLQVDHVFVDGDEITGVVELDRGGPGRSPVRPCHLDARAPGAPQRPGSRVRPRRRSRPDPRVVVAAMPDGSPLADRARLRPIAAGLRGGRAEIPVLTLHEEPSSSCPAASPRSPARRRRS